MLPNERDYFNSGDEHWVTNPFIPDRQKIRMFEEMLEHSKKIGSKNEKKRIISLIKKEIKKHRESDLPKDKSIIDGMSLIEGKLNDEL